MSQYIISIDAGTTSSRAILMDQEGKIVHKSQYEFTQHFPQPGWVEHDANEIWQTQLKALKDLLAESGKDPKEIAAIGVTNQRETTILWDRATGEPVHRAIVWQDRRTAEFCNQLKAEGKEGLFKSKTGLVIDAYFSGTKIRWILENSPELRDRAEHGELAFGTVESWLIYKLTCGKSHVSDISNASRTLIYNIHSEEWDSDLLEVLSIPESLLPEVKECSDDFGQVDESILGHSIPITGSAGDQQAALFGQLCLEPGMVKNTYGTGCFTVMNTGSNAVESNHGLLTTVGWKLNGQITYALEGSVFVAGALVQWLRDELQVIENAPEIENLASGVENNGGVTVIPALSGMGAPYWDQNARGAILGLTRGSNRSHIARAALEVIALRTMEVIQAMNEDAQSPVEELRVDGGASNNDLLMQIQSNLLGAKVTRPEETETTAMGAAFLAGLHIGFWKDASELTEVWKVDRQFTPDAAFNSEDILKNWQKGVEATKNWVG